jgi:hypothetical protein
LLVFILKFHQDGQPEPDLRKSLESALAEVPSLKIVQNCPKLDKLLVGRSILYAFEELGWTLGKV